MMMMMSERMKLAVRNMSLLGFSSSMRNSSNWYEAYLVDPDLQLDQLPRLRTKLRELVVGITANCMMDIGYVGYVDGDEVLDLKHQSLVPCYDSG